MEEECSRLKRLKVTVQFWLREHGYTILEDRAEREAERGTELRGEEGGTERRRDGGAERRRKRDRGRKRQRNGVM